MRVRLRMLLKATTMGTIMAMATSIMMTMNMLTVIINTMAMTMATLVMANIIEMAKQNRIPVGC